MPLGAFYTARSGLLASGEQVAVVANNLANSQTTGFKRSDTVFRDTFYRVQVLPGKELTPVNNGVGISFGTGVLLNGTVLTFTQGPTQTGLPMDVAIQGNGLFRVRDDQGNLFYTRNGTFQPKAAGAAGPVRIDVGTKTYTLDPPITLPGGTGNGLVDLNGVVTQDGNFVGQIQLYTFRNLEGLLAEADQLFSETPSSGPPIAGLPGVNGFGVTVDGSLEASNVDVAEELVALLESARFYNLNAEAFRAANAELLNLLRLTA